MADKREQILARIKTVLETVAIAGVEVLRNPSGVPKSRPRIILYDGGEARARAGQNQPGAKMASSVMEAQCMITVLDQRTDDIGTVINSHRAKVIKALATDATLAALTFNGVGILYDGAETGIAKAEATEIDLSLNFTFAYLLKISDL